MGNADVCPLLPMICLFRNDHYAQVAKHPACQRVAGFSTYPPPTPSYHPLLLSPCIVQVASPRYTPNLRIPGNNRCTQSTSQRTFQRWSLTPTSWMPMGRLWVYKAQLYSAFYAAGLHMETYIWSAPGDEEVGKPPNPHVVFRSFVRSFVVDDSYVIFFSADTLEYYDMTLFVGSPSSKKPARLSWKYWVRLASRTRLIRLYC